MVKLTEALVLARSRATDVENVRKFNCWGSELTDIRIIRRMSQVQVLSLSVNNISTLADFAHCLELEELYIRKNRISDLNELSYLRQLPKLRILWLADNPCASEEKYRMTVLKNLPNLQKLDNVAVQEEELNAAIEEGDDLMSPVPSSESLDVRPMRGLLANTPSAGHTPSIVSTSMPAFSILGTESRAASGDANHQDSTRCREDSSGAENGEASVSQENQGTSTSGEENPDTLSWEETNKIRVQLGLKPLPVERVTQNRKPRGNPHSHHSAKQRNTNLLQAALLLIKELDADSLDTLSEAIRGRLEDL